MEKLIHIPVDSIELEGNLVIPEEAKAIVLFSHGSGSSRHSPRNNFVAEVLQKAGMATLLFDLLTEKEDEVYETRFNIPLLTKRLIETTKWLIKQKEIKKLKIGYFGSSTGAASALEAAAILGDTIGAVVSRGGRPDLAMEKLSAVKAPTLLIVGGNDGPVIEMNEAAMEKLKYEKKLEIVPGATHLFEEPGTLEKVSELAGKWFKRYLAIKNLTEVTPR
ncbi:dienelactone hydrolase family protein [Candidatus Peregrinibacteria bacterium]|nr:dienelactone hydrolase family protein [Candidatus Peregrinibacteria bacterium]